MPGCVWLLKLLIFGAAAAVVRIKSCSWHFPIFHYRDETTAAVVPFSLYGDRTGCQFSLEKIHTNAQTDNHTKKNKNENEN